MVDDGDATPLVDQRNLYPDEGTYTQETAYFVSTSDRYPDGVKYRFQYGWLEEGAGAGTIFRYDNFPDHPGAAHHHKHTTEGDVVAVEFDGVLDLHRRFLREVSDHDPRH